MLIEDLPYLIVEQKAIPSRFLKRYVIVDLYLPKNIVQPGELSLLLLNDGQNLEEVHFSNLVNGLLASGQVQPFLCAGVHAGRDRKNEYGTCNQTDFEGRGAKAPAYRRFILDELLPFIHRQYAIESFRRQAIAGFSLGGLTAIDLTWNEPNVFSIAGVFSGSLWWRSKDLGPDYSDETDRIMHAQVREGKFVPGLRFYFTTGSQDETADRNGNGIIDSIDDTLALIDELKTLGYNDEDIRYLNYEDGRHDIPTWGRALPAFLLWAWGLNESVAKEEAGDTIKN